jgi:hypothetical protein
MPGIDTILENVHSPLNSTQQSRRKRLHFEDDDNGGDQDKEIRDIEDSFTELNINGIENDNDTESSINEEYKYIIQILPSVLRNLAEANQDILCLDRHHCHRLQNTTFSCVIFLWCLMRNAHFQVWCQ